MTQQPSPPDTLVDMSAVKLAVMAQQARTQFGAIARAEPIAIVGMGCRLPGGVGCPEDYWQLLRDGVDAVGAVPRDRWDVDAVFDPDPATPGKSSIRDGGFLDRVDEFDAGFFGIIRREAERMDPQHRLVLEVAVDALDDAGLPREQLAGTAAGVFIASYYNDYAGLQFADPEWIDARTLTGIVHSVLVNRLSYLLDLRGPSVSVDTACSSSLVAVHLACQSLRSGDSDVALAGGVSLMLSADQMITLSKVGFISPSGRCRTFDARADGFIRGEGCGIVVLKRLADAIAGGDRVLAVIRGSAVNQDGHSTVLSAPNGLAQEALVRAALANAQLSPDRVGFVEAHGTGTPLGDPIEVEALAATIGSPRADGSRCYLGSCKANIGHLEAAAGVAGLIKATLVLQHAEIPRQVHFNELNPHLSLDRTCLAVPDEHREWPSTGLPRVAGVSGFGVGGTNAHVLLEEAGSLARTAGGGQAEGAIDEARLLALSAQSPSALRALAASWIDVVGAPDADLDRLTATAGSRRSHYDHRLAVVGLSPAEFAEQLRGFLDDDPTASAVVGRRPPAGTTRVGFVFSGQGPQWAQMGRDLAAREPVFREALDDLDVRFQQIAGWSLGAALAEPAETTRLNDTEVAQPAIFAIQVALARLWEAWGICPDAVVGHSIGELAALHVAGVLSLDEAVRIVWHRGRIMQQATGLGRMMSVALSAEEAAELVAELGADASVAAVNAPRSVVLSGSTDALARAETILGERGVSTRALPVTYAFHSAQMEPFEQQLVDAVGTVDPLPARLAVYSTVTGRRIEQRDIDASYFGGNVRQTVRFADAVSAMGDDVDVVVEIAPHPVLAASITECLAARDRTVPVTASMRRGRPARDTMLQACAAVYVSGRAPRWEAVTGRPAVPAELPAYPWQRERYWVRDRPGHTTAATSRASHPEPLVGARRRDEPDGQVRFDAEWPSASRTWIADHMIAGHVLMPAAALIETMRAAVADRGGAVADFVIHQPFPIGSSAEGVTRWHTTVAAEGQHERVAVWNDHGQCIASADVAPSPVEAFDEDEQVIVTGEWCDDADALYGGFAASGVHFGPAFRTLRRWRLGDGVAEGWLSLAPSTPTSAGGVHPTLLDGALQLSVLAATSVDGSTAGDVLLPLGFDRYAARDEAPTTVRAEVRVRRQGSAGSLEASVRLYDGDDGAVVAALDGARFAPADSSALAALGSADDVYSVAWLPSAIPQQRSDAAGAWIVLADQAWGTAIVDALTSAGGRCLLVRPGDHTERDGGRDRTLAPHDLDGLRACLGDETWRDGRSLRGVVHAWALSIDDLSNDHRDDWRVTTSALHVVRSLADHDGPGVGLWLVSRGAQPASTPVASPQLAGLGGLMAVVASELPDIDCRAVDLDQHSSADDIAELVAVLLAPAGELPRSIALRDGSMLAPRLQRLAPRGTGWPGGDASPARLTVGTSGTLDDLTWTPFASVPPASGEVRLRVLAAGINFRDVLLALGALPGVATVLGAECVGVIEEVGSDVESLAVGDVVYGFAPGSLATHVDVPAEFVRPAPASLPAEQAAALPAAFLTAMYGLDRVAGIGPGSRVLVHAAAGGVGLAAIQVAQRHGAEVIATAGSPAKRDLLRRRGIAHVFDSRSDRFADDVLAVTDGRGVDVVLNSLSGPLIDAGVRALAPNGWFLELGKRDIWSPARMAEVRPDVRYRVYDLGEEARANRALLGPMLEELSSGLETGAFAALPVRCYDAADAPDAFRWMAQARHVGKLVLRTAPRFADGIVRHDGTYWVTGGAGALGTRTAQWLVDNGARHLVLTGRTEPAPDVRRVFDELSAAGAEVRYRIADAGDRAAMTAVRDEIVAEMPELRGVVHTAGTVDDGVLVAQTTERWNGVLHGKAIGAHVLDTLTRDRPLDFFVLYSAAGLHLAPRGQGSYPAANAELDALASSRRGEGLPALSVGWGQWAEAGMAARMREAVGDVWSDRGLGWLEPAAAFATLERLLRDDVTHAVVLPIDWSRFLDNVPVGVDLDFFAAVAPTRRPVGDDQAGAAITERSLVETWRTMLPAERRRALVAHITKLAHHVIGADEPAAFDEQIPLKEFGLDSLMAVELRNLLTRSLTASLPATLLFDYPSVGTLVKYLLTELALAGDDGDDVAADGDSRRETDADHAYADLVELTDDEAEALLLAELGEAERP